MMNAWQKAKRGRKADFGGTWRKIADASYGIETGDRRLAPLLEILDQADKATRANDWPAFLELAERALEACQVVEDKIEAIEGVQLGLMKG